MPTLNASARRLAVRSAIAASTGAAVLAFAPPSAAADPAPVPYPTGYRNWTHVKSLQIQSGHPLYDAFGGIHHLYANAKAMEGYRKGRFPDGAVIVFDLLEAKSADNAIQEGARKVVGVMQNRPLAINVGSIHSHLRLAGLAPALCLSRRGYAARLEQQSNTLQ